MYFVNLELIGSIKIKKRYITKGNPTNTLGTNQLDFCTININVMPNGIRTIDALNSSL